MGNQNVAVRTIITVSSFCSIFGLLFTITPPASIQSTFYWVLIILALLGAAFTVFSDIREHQRTRPKKFSGDEDIASYMQRWLSTRGRAIVVTRDMTWSTQPGVVSALKRKAAAGELIVIAQVISPLLDELKAMGGHVYDYSSIGFTPKSRFTIVGHGRVGSRVAIGFRKGEDHLVLEFDSNAEPIFSALEDVAQILMAKSKV